MSDDFDRKLEKRIMRSLDYVEDHGISRRDFLRAASIAGASVVALPGLALFLGQTVSARSPDTLVVGTNGGTWYDHHRLAAMDQFERTHNVRIEPVFGSSTELLVKALAERRRPTMDVVVSFQGQWHLGQAEGVFDRVNYANIPHVDDVYPFLKFEDEGWAPITAMFAWGICYNSEVIPNPPVAYKQLWDPKWQGQVMIGGIFHYQLHLAAFAYAWTGNQRDFDTAFEKVKELMPNVSAFYGLTSDAQAKFQEGIGNVATWYDATTRRLRKLGLPLLFQWPEEGAFLYDMSWQPITGTNKKDLVEQFIGAFYEPDAQLLLADLEGYTPTNSSVVLPDELQAELLTIEQILEANQWDWPYIYEHQDALQERWNIEVTPLLGRGARVVRVEDFI